MDFANDRFIHPIESVFARFSDQDPWDDVLDVGIEHHMADPTEMVGQYLQYIGFAKRKRELGLIGESDQNWRTRIVWVLKFASIMDLDLSGVSPKLEALRQKAGY